MQSIESMKLTELVKKQAQEGDKVSQDYLTEQATNAKRGNGFSWIETQLDMEDYDDDFRPY